MSSPTSDHPRDFLGLVSLTATQRPALCCVCGAVRAVSRRVGLYDRRLKCVACRATTKHALVGDDPEKDWRESLNQKAQPKTTRYDPLVDLTERWPGWRFECRPLEPGTAEAFVWEEKLIELDSEYFDNDWELVLAHAIAHLDLHNDPMPRRLSDQQCVDADLYAEIRLDREEDRPERS